MKKVTLVLLSVLISFQGFAQSQLSEKDLSAIVDGAEKQVCYDVENEKAELDKQISILFDLSKRLEYEERINGRYVSEETAKKIAITTVATSAVVVALATKGRFGASRIAVRVFAGLASAITGAMAFKTGYGKRVFVQDLKQFQIDVADAILVARELQAQIEPCE